jgi:hypothetical protein
MSSVKRILFDIGHGETLDITSEEFRDLKEFLKENSYEIWQLNQSPITMDMLKDYTMVIFGGPRNVKFEEEEVVEILRYLREGGAIVLANGSGGDQNNNTNLNAFATHLGFQFNGDYMAHETDYENDDFYDTVCRGVSMDPLTMGVRSIHTGYCCTLKIIDPSGAKSLEFSHEPWPESRHVAVNGYFALGRYFATSLPVFKYVRHHDNAFLLQSVLYWLSELRDKDSLI